MSSVAGEPLEGGRRTWTANRTGKDSLQSWIVCAACFWCTVCYFPFHRTTNIIYPVLARDYGFSRQLAFSMFGALVTSSCSAGIIVSYLTRWTSSRVLITLAIIISAMALALPFFGISPQTILILGAMYGIGRGVLNNQLPVILSQHFDRHRTKAVGIQRAGMCTTGFVFSIVLPWLIDQLGLQGTFLALTGVMLNALIVVVFLKNPTSASSTGNTVDKGETSSLVKYGTTESATVHQAPSIGSISNEKESSVARRWSRISHRSRKSSIGSSVLEAAADAMEILTAESLTRGADQKSRANEADAPIITEDTSTRALFKHIMFYPLLTNTFGLYLQFNVFMVMLDVAQDRGVSAQQAPLLNLIFSVGELFAYLSVGFITKEDLSRTRTMQIICQLTTSLAPLMYSVSTNFTQFALLTSVNAYATGAMLLLNVILMRQYLGEAFFARALGLTQITGILSFFVVSPLISYYRDIHKSYVPILRIVSALSFLFCFTWLLEILHVKRQRKQNADQSPMPT